MSGREPPLSTPPANGDRRPSSVNANIRHLRAFLSVTRHKSFTRAALELNVSQPTLTTVIRHLEDIVGGSLFDRTTRSVVLTPEGLDFVPLAERLIFDFDLAMEDIRAIATRRRGRIGIALVHSVATKIMPHVLLKFAADNPGIRTQLRDGNSSDVRRRVRRNEVDIGFGSKGDDDADLEFRFLFRDRMGLLFRQDHPLAKVKRRLLWEDLGSSDFIGLTEDTATGPILAQVQALPRSVAAPRFEVSMNSTLLAMLEAGIGLTAVPAMLVFGDTGPLIFKPLSEPAMWRNVYIISRRGRAATEASKDIIELVLQRLKTMAKQNPMINLTEPSPEAPR